MQRKLLSCILFLLSFSFLKQFLRKGLNITFVVTFFNQILFKSFVNTKVITHFFHSTNYFNKRDFNSTGPSPKEEKPLNVE
jgi:hypothetical protein